MFLEKLLQKNHVRLILGYFKTCPSLKDIDNGSFYKNLKSI